MDGVGGAKAGPLAELEELRFELGGERGKHERNLDGGARAVNQEGRGEGLCST